MLEPINRKIEENKRVILGSDGWKVQELQPERVLLRSGEVLPASQTIDVTKGNIVLPFYDLSALLLQWECGGEGVNFNQIKLSLHPSLF